MVVFIGIPRKYEKAWNIQNNLYNELKNICWFCSGFKR